MKRLLYFIVPLLIFTACRSRSEIEYSSDPVYTIDILGKIIDERYCFVEEKGVNWDAIRRLYMAKASTLKNNDPIALFDLCASMLDSLKDGHVNIYTPFDISRSSAWYDSYPVNLYPEQQNLYLKDYRLAGGLRYCTVDGGAIGYVYCPSFSNSISPNNIYWIITAFQNCQGLIVDVRHNGGGDLSNAYMLASAFTREDLHVGYWVHKTGTGHYDYSRPEKLIVKGSDCPSKWLRKVVVLCDRNTYSAANFFVSCMSIMPQVTVIGGISGGGGGMPMSYELPTGWTIRFSSVKMFDIYNRSIEDGIRPDEIVTTRESDTRDLIIERAIQLIHNK